MKLFDVIQNNNRFVCETLEYKGIAYLRINKMYLEKESGEWRFTPQTVMMNSECAEQYITALQKIDVMDVLMDMEKLEQEVK